MDRISDLVKGYDGQNPFSDSQARNFSDTKIASEFCPVSNFWSLFNDQHEVLLGTRGSGKTFLLKMMRYSMLKRVRQPQAEKLVSEKHFLALYVPMHLEFVTQITSCSFQEQVQIQLFQFAFNCLLADSLLAELAAILEEIPDKHSRARTNIALALGLNNMWFSKNIDDISDLSSLATKIKRLYFNFDMQAGNMMDLIPPVFKRQICSSLLSVKELVASILDFKEEPTWIICIDEAEFLSEPLQRCINSVFRSDSSRIALKVATLPYYHRTLNTLSSGIVVSPGNDFCYRVVDLPHDSLDFVALTNRLCSHRIKTRFSLDLIIEGLEDFIGVVNKDSQIDYYRAEVGEAKSERCYIEKEMNSLFSKSLRENNANYNFRRKTVYDKFAPVFFVRRMYELSKKGNSKPGWYAGSVMIRRISQGNPRIFIQIMNDLFEKARESELTPKAQHRVICDYVHSLCESTQALEGYGPTIYRNLADIANLLHQRVHSGTLISIGCSFILQISDENFAECMKWIRLAIAYSRLIVDEDTIINGIRPDTKYSLSNAYAAEYWLPMRSVHPIKISIENCRVSNLYTVSNVPSQTNQLSLFEEKE